MEPNEKGDASEREVGAVLNQIVAFVKKNYPGAVEDLVRVKRQPRITLMDGQTVIPDFQLAYALTYGHKRFLIECQDRKRSDPQIAQKIRYIKNLSDETNFIFVYRDEIPETTEDALVNAGVLPKSLEEFKKMISQGVIEHLRLILENRVSVEPRFNDMRFN
jgi:hypothetical protein